MNKQKDHLKSLVKIILTKLFLGRNQFGGIMTKDTSNNKFFSIFKVLFILAVFLVQILTFYLFFFFFAEIGKYSYFTLETIGVIIALNILGSNKKYVYKLSWTVFLVVVPISAIVFYLMFGDQRFIKKVLKREKEIDVKLNTCRIQDQRLIDSIENRRLSVDIQSIYNLSAYPAYSSFRNEYFTTGQDFFNDILEKLSNAKKYILIEFYILAQGNLYSQIKEVLIQKASEGVQIYIIYDKLGSFRRFKPVDEEELKQAGINIIAFNKNVLKPYLFINYRTHRKIVVIDGYYSYTGGCNIADEYVNIGSKFGYWKDMGIRIEGISSNSFVYAFFKSWILLTKDEIDINQFLSEDTCHYSNEHSVVIPFTDEPTNKNEIASQNYMRIIANSTDYVYITTPYLIIDEEMIACLKLAAKSGVDVRILIPGVADKSFVYELTKAHCNDLIQSGVKIYTYNPGFIHGKVIVSDDLYCTVGSVNFDFRSLLWNYECAVYMCDEKIASKIRLDYEEMLESSTLINEKYSKNKKFISRLLNGIYRLIGPLF